MTTFNTTGLCITDTAKILGIPPKEFFSWLHEHKWIFKRKDTQTWNAYQQRIKAKHVVLQAVEVASKTGTTKVVTQVRITDKGLKHLLKRVKILDEAELVAVA